MGMFSKSDDEKAASAQAKADKQEAREQQRFDASPQGRARIASANGDAFFQVEIPHSTVQGNITAMVGGSQNVEHHDAGRDVLGAIAGEGWDLIHAGWVYVQTSQESRDKLLASGQQIVTRGEVVGIYLFKRSAG